MVEKIFLVNIGKWQKRYSVVTSLMISLSIVLSVLITSIGPNSVAYASGGSFTIVASAGPGGTISPSGDTRVADRANQQYIITPNPGYLISDVVVDGLSSGRFNSYTFQNVTRGHTISASFCAASVYTIGASAGPGGTISPSGVTSVSSGSSQRYTITPDYGYSISNVSIDGVSIGASSSYTFENVTQNHNISASFYDTSVYTIGASAGPGGTISPSGSTPVAFGASQQYTITPDYGYRISDVSVDGVSIGASSSYAFQNVTRNHNISASFYDTSVYTIGASSGPGGTISPSGGTSVSSGSSQRYTITPDYGYRISNVFVDGVSIGASSSYTFENVTQNHTISASFYFVIDNNTWSGVEYVSFSSYLSDLSGIKTSGLVTSGLASSLATDKTIGGDVTKTNLLLTPLDQMINQGITTIPTDIMNIFKGKNSICVQIETNGVLPQPESVVADLGIANKDKEVCAYYFYNDGKALTFQLLSDNIKVPSDGKLIFKSNHGCNFILIEKSSAQEIKSQLAEILAKYSSK